MGNILLPLAFVAAVLAQGSDDFASREKATSWLKAKLPACIVALEVGEKWSDPEIAARCKGLLDSHYLVLAKNLDGKLLPKGRKKLPEISFLANTDYPDRHATAHSYTWYANEFIWDMKDSTARGRYATQVFLRHLIEKRTPLADVQKLLDAMGDAEVLNEEALKKAAEINGHGGP